MSARCRSCQAPIVWAETTNGKRMPIDAEPTGKALVVIVEHSTDDGSPLVAMRDTWTSHFATCPDAAKHRRSA